MREDAWLRLRPPTWGGIVALLVVGGCAGESRRIGSPGVPGDGLRASEPAAIWVPLPVVKADAEAVGDGFLLEVTVRVPGEGWRVRLTDLPPSEPDTREFRVVGRGPGGVPAASGGAPATRVIREIVPIDRTVTEIVVEGTYGAVVLGTE